MTSSRRSSESGSQPAAQQQQRCHQHHPLSTVNASFMRRSKCAACNPHAATSTTNGGLDSISTQGNASGGILTNRQRAASQSGSFQGSSGSSSGQSVVSGQRSPFSAASNEYGIANVTGPGHDKGSGTGPSANGANGANGGVPTGRLDSYYYFRRHGRLPSDENGPATNGRSWAAFEAHYFQSSHSASSIIDHSVRDYGKQPDTNTLPCKSKSHVERILSRSPTTPIPGADHPGSLTSDNASHEFPPDRRSLPATASASTSTSASASASASASGSESTHGANAGHAVALSYPTILGVQEQVTETPSDSRSTATTSASCSSQLMCSVEKNARQPQARFQQLLANSMSQSQHLAKLSQDLLSVSPNNLAKLSSDRSDPRYHQQMQECKAIVKSQKQMLDEMDSLLKAIEQTTTTVSESFIATPSSSISSDWMENKAAWMRWNVSRLIGGTVGTGDIVGYEKTADGMAVVVVAGTSVTTEASLLPKHLGPVQATAGVYHHRYILHLTRDDQKHNFALLPVSEWQPDHEAQQCELKDTGCSAQFGWLQRRHHCRKCGRVYCHTHSTNRLPLFEPQTERAHWSRVCDSCFYQLAGPHLINSSNSTSTSH
ncbi:uncharacterized protein BYT42DRAFT_287680 [Radiomyces spectabilis]|uniref:uncharacterized protein n=1 Tax=Radiomyces spectabilis TaxID=64574 RepID=UPI00221F76F2|nr:uncharacterized protein BYT42DRAFT_287680 [Radiomyces spectabilis]KAI8380984.1 hypothetical protein BYT42DRAFT_287680 [Radiomyces spectabilis]